MAYTAVTVEGGLLPSDFLDRIAEGESEGQRPQDFGPGAGPRLTDTIQGAFSDARAYWEAFKRRRAHTGERLTSVTRESWAIPLLESLGFDDLSYRQAATVAGDASYPISYWAGDAEAAPPVHIVAFEQALDRRDGSRRSPHGLVQEYLNRSDALWGIVTNGERLRLLRDSARLSRPSYIEFDLQGIVEGNLYSEFVPLYRLLHRSRLPRDAGDAHTCLLERYYQQGVDEGGRVREHLRSGVEKALEELGNAFLGHPQSGLLRESLRSGRLKVEAYYRQLLRLVYRVLFLFVAEERRLVFPAGTEHARLHEIYARDYSLRRLRDRCERSFSGDQYSDLWQGVLQTFAVFREQGLAERLGLAALNGELFGATACRDLETAGCENAGLLRAVYQLSTFEDGKVRRRVNYAGLNVEELGSIYESLLDFRPHVRGLSDEDGGLSPHHPVPSPQSSVLSPAVALAPRFELVAGGERKQTGSYYTPPSLVRELIESALVPVIEERLAAAALTPALSQGERVRMKEQALLALRVCDPASGSGHFLLAAARRIARELAKVRTGEAEPPPEPYREALRDVIRACIYAVDKNPLAVDLCKVALWIEGHNAGLPLSFLDNHIRCGDSLVGVFDLGVLEAGIPDEAYAAVTGDDKAVASALKKRNKQEREGQMRLGAPAEAGLPRNVAEEFGLLGTLAERTPADVRAKEAIYDSLRGSGSRWWALKTACDLWTAAFFAPARTEDGGRRTEGGGTQSSAPSPQSSVPTTDALRACLRGLAVDAQLRGEANGLSQRLGFFHWPLEFPEVFAAGGFDVVLGNPPWERIKPQEQEFFAGRDREIATAANKAARERLLQTLPQHRPELAAEWQTAKHDADAQSAFVRGSGRFPLCGRGDVNTYSIFAEADRSLLSPSGRAGVIVPTGIATDDTTKFFFQSLVDGHSLVGLHSFENEAFIFPAVHHATKFCLLTIAGPKRQQVVADFVFFIRHLEQLPEPGRHFTLTADDIALLNPNTRTCPIFRSRRDAELTKAIYRRVPVLIREGPPEENPWGISFLRMFDMSGDSGLFRTGPSETGLRTERTEVKGLRTERGQTQSSSLSPQPPSLVPLYEAKMLHHFDHRFGDYRDQPEGSENTHLPDVPLERLQDPSYSVQPRYWVPADEVEKRLAGRWDRGWLLGWRDICRATDERTVIAGVLPRVGVGDTGLLMLPAEEFASLAALIPACLDSFVLDYAARQKVGGTHLKYHVFKQLPVLPPATYEQPCPWSQSSDLSPHPSLAAWIAPRVLELTYTAWDLQPFARDLGYDGPPFVWDDERRFLLRCELDAAFFHLYGIERGGVDYIMETFPIVKRRDVQRHGEYRAKRVILEIYDAMQRAIETGGAYQTWLDPPPADPRVGHSTTSEQVERRVAEVRTAYDALAEVQPEGRSGG